MPSVLISIAPAILARLWRNCWEIAQFGATPKPPVAMLTTVIALAVNIRKDFRAGR